MKLTEFSLWAFKLELNDSRKFTLFNRCVCAHFERYFEPIETDGIYRVVVKLCDQDERVGTTELSSSVIKYYKEFDFSNFESLDLSSKKYLLLRTLYEALIQLCDMLGWPKIAFSKAYQRVVQDEFVNTYTIRRKLTKNRKLSAELIGYHNEHSFDCSLVISSNTGKEIFRVLLFSEEPDEFLFNARIGDIRWINNSTVVHLSKDKQELARFDVGDIKIKLPPA